MSRLHRAAARGDLAWLRRWRWGLRVLGIDSRDQEKRTPLHLACANGHADVVRFLVRQDCQVDLSDNWRRSPLMKAVQSQQEECVAVLLEHGANPDLQDADGNTALHLAVLSHNVDMVLLLLEHDADIDAENKEGCTPLILAVSEHHKEMAEVLLKIGADVQARDLSERTPLMIAASGGQLDLVRVLLEFGADVSQKDAAGSTAGDVAVLQGYSRSSEEEGNDDSWSSSEEELDFSPKGMVLAGALERQSKSEALLEETKCCCRELRKRNLGLQEELEEVKSKVQDLADWHWQSACCVGGLRVAWDEEEGELRASFQKLQDLLLASSGTDGIIKELEERVQRLQMENARLEATVQQQSNRSEGLWRDLQASAWVDQLSQPLQTESKKDTGTEAEVGVSQEEFSSERGNQEQLEKSEQQLQEEEKLLAASPVQRPSEPGRPGTYEALSRKPSSVRSIRVGRRIYTFAAKDYPLFQCLKKKSQKVGCTEAETGESQKELPSKCGSQQQLGKSQQQLQEEPLLDLKLPILELLPMELHSTNMDAVKSHGPLS
ncbi:ankyrin repeat domain-containing protein 18A-like [Apus apus]|uniref:ankyrin repeat domain-containing protein 18A-like n=1 Tax=Apus apus TaxID=8895 RepID=UPI0021F89A4D|nr:ankyrin repeat domain-containing protein 18A-like [Apus apus]